MNIVVCVLLMLLLVLLLMLDLVLVVVFALVLVLMLMIKILFMMMFVKMLTRSIVQRNLMCTKMEKCCLMVIFNAYTICKNVRYCVVVECVCVVWCVFVCVQAFVSGQCVWVVCLCKGGGGVCLVL